MMNRQYVLVLAFSALLLAAHAQPAIIGRNSEQVRVLFGGDTYFGERYQEDYAQRGGTNILVEKGYDYCVTNLSRLLAVVDYRILNLEAPLTAHNASAFKPKEYRHYGDPLKLPSILGRYGPIAYTLANNHGFDQGVVGFEDTIFALKAAQAQWFGAGNDLSEASRPLLQKIQVGGSSVTLAVFGGFEYQKMYDERFHFYAGAKRPGIAAVDVPGVSQAIRALRQRVPDAFVVYFVHREANYHWKDAEQAALLHSLRAAGVDLVVCAGAHMMQEIEYDGRGWIFYGLGNFLFNSKGAYVENRVPPYSLPLMVDFSMNNGRLQTGLRVYPIVSDNQITAYRPRFVTEAELSEIETLLAGKSGWDAPTHAAVKRGADGVGRYLEFFTPRQQ
jgi:hypothetical protein